MKKYIFALLLLIAGAADISAQSSMVTVYANNITDSAGNRVNGTIFFQPMVDAGTTASYQKPGGGVGVVLPVQATITSGSFSIQLPDTAHTNPVNLCFAVGATQQYTKTPLLAGGYQCVQPHYTSTTAGDWCVAGVCDFDQYIPNLAANLPVVQGPTGATGPQGASSITGMSGDGQGNATLTGEFTAGALKYGNNYGSIDTFGDSITQGTGASTFMAPGVADQQTCWGGDVDLAGQCYSEGPTAYAYRLQADYGNSGHDFGRGGDTAEDMTWHFAQWAHPQLQNNPIRTFMIGTNDNSLCSTNANCQDTAFRAELYATAQAAIPDALKTYASACSKTGSWTADSNLPGAMYTTTNGSSLTCTSPSSAPVAYIAYEKCDNTSNGTASVTINGAAGSAESTINFFGAGGSSIYFNNQTSFASGSGQFSHCSLALARNGGSATQNTTTITATNGGKVEVFWVGSPYVAPATAVAPPLVVIGGVPYEVNNAGQPGVSQYNTIAQNTYNVMSADGNNVLWANVEGYMNSTTDFNGGLEGSGDSVCGVYSPNGSAWAASWLPPLHPGDGGMCHIYEAFHNVLKPVVLPSQALCIYGGPQGRICGDQSTGGRYGADNGLDGFQSGSLLTFRQYGQNSVDGIQFITPGSDSVSFAQWGAGAGANLAGVTGLIDNTKPYLIWNATPNGDFCVGTATGYGVPNASACAGSTFFVAANSQGAKILAGINANQPGVYNGRTIAGSTALFQIDGQAQALNAELVLQTNYVNHVPIFHLVNKQAASGQRDWSMVHTGTSLVIGTADDAETVTTPEVTITTSGIQVAGGVGPTGVMWTSGTGVPSGSCTNGSLYTSQNGTLSGNNNFYVCAAGAWLAVK